MEAELKRNIAELDQLIDEILLSSRLDAMQEAHIAGEALDLSALLAEECVRTGARLDAQLVSLQGDAKLVRRMVRNLLENPRRYGGDTVVDVVLSVDQAGIANLKICDRGPGIPEAERERIFEAFYRLSGARETEGGVGLGLALVRQIAERHGGSVQCLAREGGGSCFLVRLPIHPVATQNA
jgi:signal transduction histidine kinase